MKPSKFDVLISLVCLTGLLASTPPGLASPNLELARQLNQAFVEVAEKVSPAVVVITVTQKASTAAPLEESDELPEESSPREFWRWFHRRIPEESIGQGSGVIIRENGYILTNRHVVEDTDTIEVRLRDGRKFKAVVRGVDPQSDVAVIKIDARGLPVAKFADSTKTRVGEFAIAIGAPFQLDYSVTFGHVSAKGRSRIIPDEKADQDFIQTDANINPGNSGGPLVNIDGEVIGINTLIRGLHTGIGFAIPVNLAREISDKLISDGKFVRAYLGVKIESLNEYTELRGMIPGVKEGVVVKEIPPGGPAAKSDLKAGDIITAVDSKPVSTAQQLKSEIRGKKLGQQVALDVFRNGKTLKVKVKPEAWPDEVTQVANKPGAAPEAESKDLGLTVRSLTKDLAEQFGVDKIDGLIVTEVESGSAAERKGLRPGDIITEVNQRSVTSPKQFRDALKNAAPRTGVIINFTSKGTSKFEILKESGD